MNILRFPTVDETVHLNGRDVKARRRTNTSDVVANITAAEIEAGSITLERIQSLNVPVYLYSGQITIHGRLPDVTAGTDALGYKSVFRNGNGSLGVRYNAIDAEKKKLILDYLRHSSAEDKWRASVNSTTFLLYKKAVDIDEAKKFLDGVPEGIYGKKNIVRDPIFGTLYSVVYINAIPQDMMDSVLFFFSKMTAGWYKSIKSAYDAEIAARKEEYKKREEAKKLETENIAAEFARQRVKAKFSGYVGFGDYDITSVSLYNCCIHTVRVKISQAPFGKINLAIIESGQSKLYKKSEWESFVTNKNHYLNKVS